MTQALKLGINATKKRDLASTNLRKYAEVLRLIKSANVTD